MRVTGRRVGVPAGDASEPWGVLRRGGRRGFRAFPRAWRSGCLLIGQDFLGELNVSFGSTGRGVIKKDGFAVARGFGETDVAGDDGAEDLVAEEFAEVGGDELGEVGAVVKHGEEDAFGFEGVVEGVTDAV